LGFAGGEAEVGKAVHIDLTGVAPVQGVVDYVTSSFIGVRAEDALVRFHGRARIGMTVAVSHHAYVPSLDDAGVGGDAAPDYYLFLRQRVSAVFARSSRRHRRIHRDVWLKVSVSTHGNDNELPALGFVDSRYALGRGGQVDPIDRACHRAQRARHRRPRHA
jgi:hypothetical protein